MTVHAPAPSLLIVIVIQALAFLLSSRPLKTLMQL